MRKTGNTNLLVQKILDSAKKRNSEVEIKVLQISQLQIEPCRGCTHFCKKNLYQCLIRDDLETVFGEMKNSQAIVIGSPLYFYIPSRLTALIERLVTLSYFYETKHLEKPEPLEGKPCGLVAVCAEYGVSRVLEYLFDFVLHLKMKPMMMNSYPYLGVGGNAKLEKDEALNPLENAEVLGKLLLEAIEARI